MLFVMCLLYTILMWITINELVVLSIPYRCASLTQASFYRYIHQLQQYIDRFSRFCRYCTSIALPSFHYPIHLSYQLATKWHTRLFYTIAPIHHRAQNHENQFSWCVSCLTAKKCSKHSGSVFYLGATVFIQVSISLEPVQF